MRTQTEIVARIEDRKAGDPLGFEWPIYLEALEFDSARPYLTDVSTLATWTEGGFPKSEETLHREAVAYLAFAWEKANGCRGISASRSIMHYQAWLWLLGEEWGDEMLKGYGFYGKPQLVKISEYFGVDPAEYDDGIRSNTEY